MAINMDREIEEGHELPTDIAWLVTDSELDGPCKNVRCIRPRTSDSVHKGSATAGKGTLTSWIPASTWHFWGILGCACPRTAMVVTWLYTGLCRGSMQPLFFSLGNRDLNDPAPSRALLIPSLCRGNLLHIRPMKREIDDKREKEKRPKALLIFHR